MAEDKPQLPPEVQQALKNDAAKSAASNPQQPKSQPQEPVASHQTDQVQTIQYPSEVVELPSRGWFYDPTSPLASGKIDIKYMTAKEEDILTSQNLIKKGAVLEKLMDSLILTPGINTKDLVLGEDNKKIKELNIGHTIVASSIAVGLQEAVREMKRLVQNPRREPLFG